METQPIPLNADLSNKINGLIDTMNQQKNAICDAKCMRNKELQKLFLNYTSAKKDFRNGEKNIETAEEKYYLADKGSYWYSNFKRTNAEKASNEDILKIQTNLDSQYKDMRRTIGYYESQLIYRKRMEQLLNNYNDKLETAQSEVKQLDSDTNISKRLSRYYEKDMEWSSSAFYYIHNLYWILAIIIIVFVLWGFYKKKFTSSSQIPMITVFCFVFIPLVLKPFFIPILNYINI